MSQHLLIKFEETPYDNPEFYDAIYDQNGTLKEILDWIGYSKGFHFGPFKIHVIDAELMPFFEDDFMDLYPLLARRIDDIWEIRWNDHFLKYPTKNDFHELFGSFYTEENVKYVQKKRTDYLERKWSEKRK